MRTSNRLGAWHRTLDREAAAGYHADMTLPDLPATPGAYVLLLTADTPVVLNMPRFGKLTLAAGQYAYVGSAHGPGGLRARVGRHLSTLRNRSTGTSTI